MTEARFDVFGRIFLVRRVHTWWETYAIGADGKRAPAGFVVPDFIEEAELEQFLFDLFHESAVKGSGGVRRITGG